MGAVGSAKQDFHNFVTRRNIWKHILERTVRSVFQDFCLLVTSQCISEHTMKRRHSAAISVTHAFFTIGNLKLHIRKHPGQKLFDCNECGVSFALNGSLNKHIDTYTGWTI